MYNCHDNLSLYVLTKIRILTCDVCIVLCRYIHILNENKLNLKCFVKSCERL